MGLPKARRRELLTLCIIAFFLLVPVVKSRALDNDVVAKAVAAWEARRQATKTVHVLCAGTMTYTRGCFSGDHDLPEGFEGEFPKEDKSFPVRNELFIDLETNRFRQECDRQMIDFSVPSFVPHRAILAFDGSVVWYDSLDSDNSGENPQVTLAPKDDHFWGVLNWEDLPVFFGIGVVRESSVKLDNLQPSPPQLTLAKYVQRDGHECIILRTLVDPSKMVPSHTEFTVDPSREYIVLQMANYQGDFLSSRMDLEYQLNGSTWVPSGWDITMWMPTQESESIPKEHITLSVTAWDINSALSPMVFDYKPRQDSLVMDNLRGEYYRIGRDGEKTLLDRSTGTVINSSSHNRWMWVVSVAILAAVVVVGVSLRRRNHGHS